MTARQEPHAVVPAGRYTLEQLRARAAELDERIERQKRWLSIFVLFLVSAISLLVLWSTHRRCFEPRTERPAAAAQHGAPAVPAGAGR